MNIATILLVCVVLLSLICVLRLAVLCARADFGSETYLPRTHAKIIAGNPVTVRSGEGGSDNELCVFSIGDTATAVALKLKNKDVCVIVDDADSGFFQRCVGKLRCALNGIPYGSGAEFMRAFTGQQ